MTCDATGQTSAQDVASSELPPVDSIYRVSYIEFADFRYSSNALAGRKDLHRLLFCVQTTRKLKKTCGEI